MNWLLDYNIWASFVTLTLLEIVLSIDNVIFVALAIQHLPEKTRYKARTIAVAMALILRIVFIFSLGFLMGMDKPLFFIASLPISGKSLFLVAGGLFLIYKAVGSIHEMFTHEEAKEYKNLKAGFWGTVMQAIFIDLVFSFDSIITAIGMTQNIPVIVAAMVISMIAMVMFVKVVSKFITHYPTLKMLAICFILMIGVLLVVEAFGTHIPRGYIYFAMAFSILVESLNIGMRKKIS